VPQTSAAPNIGAEEGIVQDGDLIDFRVGQARQTLRLAVRQLQEMLDRLNAHPGRGINFDLIYEIVRAEQIVGEARQMLIRATSDALKGLHRPVMTDVGVSMIETT
jgi:hypothetical protein